MVSRSRILQKADHGPTLSLRIFIRFARKNSPSGNQPLVTCLKDIFCLCDVIYNVIRTNSYLQYFEGKIT